MATTSRTQVRCPGCGASLAVSPAAGRGAKCPRCQRSFSLAAPGASKSPPPVAAPLSLAGFVAASWRHARGSWFLPLLLGVASLPVLSLAKPLLGRTGLVAIGGISLAIALSAAAAFVVFRVGAYLFGRERSVAEGYRNRLAPLAQSAAVAACGFWLPLAAAERLAPDRGVLTTAVPKLERVQAALLRPFGSAEIADDEEAVATSNDGDAATAEPQAEPSSAEAAEMTVAFAPEDDAPAAAPDESASRGTAKGREAAAGSTQSVVAEGVGTTPQEALKDAFRGAVRQVVGAVVDAGTLIENDEIIEDRVLTYGDGFIKNYEEVPKSRIASDGLHRVKIHAVVERRNVVEKLKAANVTLKKVDGKGLFAEAVTAMEAEGSAVEILKAKLEGFPETLLTATVVGKPELLEKTAERATIRVRIRVEPDAAAFKSFVERLRPIASTTSRTRHRTGSDVDSSGPPLESSDTTAEPLPSSVPAVNVSVRTDASNVAEIRSEVALTVRGSSAPAASRRTSRTRLATVAPGRTSPKSTLSGSNSIGLTARQRTKSTVRGRCGSFVSTVIDAVRSSAVLDVIRTPIVPASPGARTTFDGTASVQPQLVVTPPIVSMEFPRLTHTNPTLWPSGRTATSPRSFWNSGKWARGLPGEMA